MLESAGASPAGWKARLLLHPRYGGALAETGLVHRSRERWNRICGFADYYGTKAPNCELDWFNQSSSQRPQEKGRLDL